MIITPTNTASTSCRCSQERKTHLQRQKWSSTGKPVSSAESFLTSHIWLDLPTWNHLKLVSSFFGSGLNRPPSNDMTPVSSSRNALGPPATDFLFDSMDFACACVMVSHTERKLEISFLSLSSCVLMNLTCMALKRSLTSPATSRMLPHASSSWAVTGRKGLATGSIAHSEKTWSHCTTKRRNSWRRLLPPRALSTTCPGAWSFTTFDMKRWKSRRLASKLRSARVACVSMDFATQASSSATVSV
mmetsp:Transcript_8916/g.27058  ORF Transcript_8916/g.27058 Transcript_8916/m.27058 type:complete len:245 (+) Transcript_8916:580-1314(+)